MKRVELLSPAGSFEAAIAAVNAGADAIYIGGSLFGARAYAKNPESQDLLSIIEYAHIHGSRVYLTVNTLLKSVELEDALYNYILPFYENGLDAVIVQDLGVFSFIKKHLPGLHIHCSTQMTISDPAGARLMTEAGASRVVLSRELSLEEIRAITNEGISVECFIHGALCYCYSGQCLMSSIFGGRSGNRGRCAQPCRLPYEYKGEKKYLLSPKDLCTVNILPKLIDAGIYSFKIEGRMKRAEYTAAVTSVYRKYIDLALSGADYRVDPEDMKALLSAGNRGGFTEGYYNLHNGPDMMAVNNPSIDTAGEDFFKKYQGFYEGPEPKEKIGGTLMIKKGQPLIITLDHKGLEVRCEGQCVQAAQKAPLTEEGVRRQILKTGDTPFEFERLDIDMDNDAFLPVKALNEIRREALDLLREKIIVQFHRTSVKPHSKRAFRTVKKAEKTAFSVLLKDERLLDIVLSKAISRIYLEPSLDISTDKRNAEKIKAAGIEAYLALPYIFREKERQTFDSLIHEYDKCFHGFLVRNIDELGYIKEKNLKGALVSDYRLYSFNGDAAEFLTGSGIRESCAPIELNKGELMKNTGIYNEMLAYGHLPLMISAQCVKNTISGCNKANETILLKDRYNKDIIAKSDCKYCYGIIYNGQPLYLGDLKSELDSLGVSLLRLEFSDEEPSQVEAVFRLFETGAKFEGEFTRGHFTRGVE